MPAGLKFTPPYRFDLQDRVALELFEFYEAHRDLTMIPRARFVENLLLIRHVGTRVDGAFVECGTWKGGMSAGMIAVGGAGRNYHFFDSFAGLPPAQRVDGPDAFDYQRSTDSPLYYDNCTAEYESFAALIRKQPIAQERIRIYPGWFKDTLPELAKQPISVLRLDGDWYESTMECLVQLFDLVVAGGIVILDDYDRWDGCARAVHDYLSQTRSTARIRRTNNEFVPYIFKLE